MSVLLGGDGGNQVWRQRKVPHQRNVCRYLKLPAFVRHLAIEPVATSLQRIKVMAKVQRHIERAHLPNPDRYAIDRFVQEFPLDDIVGPVLPHNGDRLATVRRHYAAAPASSELNRLLYIDIKMTMGDEDVPKACRRPSWPASTRDSPI